MFCFKACSQKTLLSSVQETWSWSKFLFHIDKNVHHVNVNYYSITPVSSPIQFVNVLFVWYRVYILSLFICLISSMNLTYLHHYRWKIEYEKDINVFLSIWFFKFRHTGFPTSVWLKFVKWHVMFSESLKNKKSHTRGPFYCIVPEVGTSFKRSDGTTSCCLYMSV